MYYIPFIPTTKLTLIRFDVIEQKKKKTDREEKEKKNKKKKATSRSIEFLEFPTYWHGTYVILTHKCLLNTNTLTYYSLKIFSDAI